VRQGAGRCCGGVRGCDKVLQRCESVKRCREGARRCHKGFGCHERVQEVIEGAGGWLYHRLLAGRRQERDMTYSFGSGYWRKVGLMATPECRKFAVGRVVGANSAEREWEYECERRLN
jgi:hypothetical protein